MLEAGNGSSQGGSPNNSIREGRTDTRSIAKLSEVSDIQKIESEKKTDASNSLIDVASSSSRALSDKLSLNALRDFHQRSMNSFSTEKHSNLQTNSDLREMRMLRQSSMRTPVPVQNEVTFLLMYAAYKNDFKKISSLIASGINPNVTDYDGRSPLHIAASEGHVEMVKALIDHGAEVNKTDRWGCTPLDDAMVAGEKGEEVVKLLADTYRGKSGSDMKSSNLSKRLTTFDSSQSNGFKRHKAASKSTVLDPASPVANFLFFAAHGNISAMESMVKEGAATANMMDYDKRTAAHLAACEGHLKILQFLTQNGVTFNVKDRWGNTPYNDAIRAGHNDCADFIAENGGGEEFTRALPHNSEAEFETLHARGLAEKWALNAKELRINREPFARGAGGELFMVQWRGLECVAKSCAEMAANDEQIATDLGNEISLMATLRHPNLVMFLGACFQTKPPILLMEYCEGGTLERKLITSKVEGKYTLSKELRYRFIKEIAQGMCFLHGSTPPIVHRDLKPSNVLLNADLRIKVTDFGLSKFIPAKNKTMNDTFVMTGETGSYRFMAPEVFKHEQYNLKVDVYSFALIAYWIITGIRPFYKIIDPVEAVRRAALEGLRPPLSMLDRNRAQQGFLNRCWAQEAADRPSFEEILEIWKDFKEDFQSPKFFTCFS